MYREVTYRSHIEKSSKLAVQRASRRVRGKSHKVIIIIMITNYVKTVGVITPSKWGYGGQEVPDEVSCESHSIQLVISDNFYKRVSSQKLPELCLKCL